MENKIANEYGETWTKVTDDDVITRVTKSLAGCDSSNLKLDRVTKVVTKFEETEEHFSIHLYGGKNGSGQWNEYLVDLLSFINKLKEESIGTFKEVWLISLKNDCADDVFDVYIGVRQ